MNGTALILVNIDGSQEQGGFTQVLDSPAGASGFGFFSWPFTDRGYNDEIDKWFEEKPEYEPRELGENLFHLIFPEKPREKLKAALTQSLASDTTFIAIQSASPELHRIPFEISHTGEEYLTAANRIVFRLVNDGSGIQPLAYSPRRVLVILAEPVSDDYDAWGHDQYADKIKQFLTDWGVHFKILLHAKPSDVQDDLIFERNSRRSYDLILVVAHGEAASAVGSGYLILEGPERGPVAFSGDQFATALTGHQGCMVFLCSCSSAQVIPENPIAGVAQRLITAGPAGSVVAMQRPVTVETGIKVSVDFLSYLRKGNNVLEAYRDSVSLRAQGGWEHGVPCVYSRKIADPEKARLCSFLSVDPQESKFAVIFPTFQMGVKPSDYGQAKDEGWFQIPEGRYYYRGETAAMTAIGAAKDLIATLGSIFAVDDSRDRIAIQSDHQTKDLFEDSSFTHYVLFGTRSHPYVRTILSQYKTDFDFVFGDQEWQLIDKRENKSYRVPNPVLAKEGIDPGMDYALIEKIIDETHDRVIFVIGGMWHTGTLTAGRYLIEKRDQIFATFGSGGFQYLLEIPAGTTQVKRVVIERGPLRAP